VLAREMLGGGVKVLTTLHGTDVTLVGQEKNYLAATRYGIERSDIITAVSRHLADETVRLICQTCKLRVIYNFVDTERYRPHACDETRAHFAKPDERVLMHVSNFRPVKRAGDAVRVFAEVAREMPARLLLVGEGPDLVGVEELAAELGVGDRVSVLGLRSEIEELLPCADLFLLPSESESFGLAALEAMACGVVPLASSVGGIPEVIEDGVSGILCEPGDIGCMSRRAMALLSDSEALSAMSSAARARAVGVFDRSLWIGEYEAAYRELLAS
jgi:N-acetyl-alpha-D-glucosaminyl L-malate synthase BshA